ncbi:hypothetical protein Tco_0596365 [Tanacetum coccineum]
MIVPNTMAEQNVPAQPPTRTDEQIVPRSQWLTIGKSNLLFQRTEDSKEPHLSDIILETMRLTPVNPTYPFELPPSGDTGIVTQTNVDHAELIWEEFTQGIHTFFSHKASHKASLKNPKKKKTPQERASVQPATQRAHHTQKATNSPHHQINQVTAPPPTKKPSKTKLSTKIRKGKPAFQLVDEEDEAQQESIPQREDDDPVLNLAKKLSLEAHQEKGEEENNNADLERAIKLSLDPVFLPQGQAPVGGVTIRDPVSKATPELHEVVERKGRSVGKEEQVAHSLIDLSKKKRTTDQFILARRDQSPPDSTTGPSSQPDDDTSEKVIHESSSTSDSERTESETEADAPKGDKDQGKVDSSTITSEYASFI